MIHVTGSPTTPLLVPNTGTDESRAWIARPAAGFAGVAGTFRRLRGSDGRPDSPPA